MKIDRRNALSLLALTGAAPFAITETKAAYTGHVLFEHGVASGDPLQDRVVLWTRVTPVEAGSLDIPVEWQVAQDQTFRTIVAHGRTTTNTERDFTVKVDAEGLKAAQRLFLSFPCGQNSFAGGTHAHPARRSCERRGARFRDLRALSRRILQRL